MPLYTNCALRVKVPANYSRKDELTKALESEFVGCEMNFEESETSEPYVEEAIVPEATQLGGLQPSEWASLGGTGSMGNVSGEFLIRSASEKIRKFLEDSK
jgi:hypothetical protein